MASKFPSEIDSFRKHYDPSPDDLAKIERYKQLSTKNKSPYEEQEFIRLSKELEKFVFTSEELNTMQDAMVNMQTFFRDNTVEQLKKWEQDSKARFSEMSEEISLDTKRKFIEEMEKYKSGFAYRGEYDEKTLYKKDNMVRFEKNIYRCKVEESVGIPPSSSENWEKLIESIKGEDGSNLKFVGDYVKANTYKENDIVVFDGVLLVCLKQTQSEPATLVKDEYVANEGWKILFQQKKQKDVDVVLDLDSLIFSNKCKEYNFKEVTGETKTGEIITGYRETVICNNVTYLRLTILVSEKFGFIVFSEDKSGINVVSLKIGKGSLIEKISTLDDFFVFFNIDEDFLSKVGVY